MLTIRRLAIAAGALLWPIVAGAVTPTLTDIAACNEEAAARTSASALPAPPGAAPRAERPQAPIVQGERELPRRAAGEKSDPTGSIVTESPDPLATGMDAQRAGDPAYRAAYRECLKGRVGGSR